MGSLKWALLPWKKDHYWYLKATLHTWQQRNTKGDVLWDPSGLWPAMLMENPTQLPWSRSRWSSSRQPDWFWNIANWAIQLHLPTLPNVIFVPLTRCVWSHVRASTVILLSLVGFLLVATGLHNPSYDFRWSLKQEIPRSLNIRYNFRFLIHLHFVQLCFFCFLEWGAFAHDDGNLTGQHGYMRTRITKRSTPFLLPSYFHQLVKTGLANPPS